MATTDTLTRSVELLESAERLDPFAAFLRRRSTALPESVRRAMGGEWLGHPLHPALTDVVTGSWTSSFVLDLIGGRAARPASQRLVGLGVLSAMPTLVAGLVDLARLDDQGRRRVAAVHAAGNAAATLVYTASWRWRARGRHGRGVVLGAVGGAIASVTAHLGGHLAFGKPSSEPAVPAIEITEIEITETTIIEAPVVEPPLTETRPVAPFRSAG